MRITEEKKVLVLEIEYVRLHGDDEWPKVLEYLDNRFGKYKYRIRKSGPKSMDGPLSEQLAIVEAYIGA